MKTSVIIVTYNGMKWIDKCLSSVLSSVEPPIIIIVDNASTDDTTTFIELNYPQVRLIKSDVNLGFGQANNRGIAEAIELGSEYVFLLNQDAYVEPNTISKLVMVASNYSEYGILSPIHLNGDGSKIDFNFLDYISNQTEHSLVADAVRNKLQPIYNYDFLNAAAWLIPVAIIKKVGGFDPLFFHYGEDVNFCQRIQYFNLKIGVIPETVIYHDREEWSQKPLTKYSDEYYQFFEKKTKVYWADINNNKFNSHYQKRIAYYRRRMFKALFRLSFKDFEDYKRKYHSLKNLKADIFKSRQMNLDHPESYFSVD